MKNFAAVILSLTIIICTTVCPCLAVTKYDEWAEKWSEIRSSDGYIMLTPGTDNTEMNFSWQSPFMSKKGTISISADKDMKDAVELSVRRTLCIFSFEWTQEATAENLRADTTYYYQYTSNNTVSKIYSFKTGTEDETNFAYVVDAQIGRSYLNTDDETYMHDTYGWSKTVETIVENNDVDFIISGGDQINTSYSDYEYTYFESPEQLRSLPVATAIGNHEFYTTNYTHHFYNPNRNTVNAQWPSGNGYYFCRNDVLFIVLDSNNIVFSAHKKIISNAVKAYPDAKWKVLTMHHSPYDANAEGDFFNMSARVNIVPLIDKYDIDIVLCGHDHYFSRSYMIKNNKVTNDVAINGVYTNPKGTIYLTANTCSGCNFDRYNENEVNKYTDLCRQDNIPEYTIVNVLKDTMTITTYETDNNTITDKISIIKNK